MSLHEPPDHSDNSHNATDAKGPMIDLPCLPPFIVSRPGGMDRVVQGRNNKTHKGDLFVWKGSSLHVPKSMTGRRARRHSDLLYPFYA